MQETIELPLIHGVFDEEEAREILLNLFSAKIRFHESRNFSMIERFGYPCTTAKERIPQLSESMQQVKELAEIAKEQNKVLRIHAAIHIELIDPS